MTPQAPADTPHIPVLLEPLLTRAAPVSGTWVDGTFGAGCYARGLIEAGAERVIGIDRDPEVFERARPWAGDLGDRLRLIEGTFAEMAELVEGPVAGVVLDIGVSSMQLDQPERGFSFLRDGPLDMRMGRTGPTAAEIVNTVREAELADILFQYGEEKAARRIARAIVAARAAAPIETTGRLAEIIAGVVPARPGASHPATRSFQALRIAVNDELGQLVRGLYAAERLLAPGGLLAVVTFHSLEDRIVKRFLAARSARLPAANRWSPEAGPAPEPRFELMGRAIAPDDEELARNPRARSARLRMARRTSAPQGEVTFEGLGLPRLAAREVSR